ncbi:50S ribosomal protein L18 [Patescibacteria group bacterium]|nr:50S ribosomal protein L18 [Patescibacteria group bacterium]
MNRKNKQDKRKARHNKIRAKINGTSKCPRLFVFRSNKYIYAQVIDDNKAHIILSANSQKINNKTKTQAASEVGKLVGQGLIGKEIKKIVFDRGGYKYHGRVKALAEAVRKQGIIF